MRRMIPRSCEIDTAAASFWRRTPPALFPSTLGVIGLSIGWRNYGGVGAALADPIFMLGAGFFAFAFASYLAKLAARPAALMQDLDPIEGRAAVSAGSMCLMMIGACFHRDAGFGALAEAIWFGGLLLHILYAGCVAFIFFSRPAFERLVAPPLFLPAIGVIVAPIGGVSMGFEVLSTIILAYCIPMGLLIGWLSFRSYRRGAAPFFLRPAAAIALAPASVAGSVSGLMGYETLFVAFLCLSICLAAGCLLGVRWLTAGGFTPLWGAFTFPSSAFAALLVMAASRWGGAWDIAAPVALIAATCVILPIWAITVRRWAGGTLARATGAATA